MYYLQLVLYTLVDILSSMFHYVYANFQKTLYFRVISPILSAIMPCIPKGRLLSFLFIHEDISFGL